MQVGRKIKCWLPRRSSGPLPDRLADYMSYCGTLPCWLPRRSSGPLPDRLADYMSYCGPLPCWLPRCSSGYLPDRLADCLRHGSPLNLWHVRCTTQERAGSSYYVSFITQADREVITSTFTHETYQVTPSQNPTKASYRYRRPKITN